MCSKNAVMSGQTESAGKYSRSKERILFKWQGLP